MKKTLIFFLSLVLVFGAVAGVALADVIWEPEDDSFFVEHYMECRLCDRVYTARGDVDVYVSPESQEAVDMLEDGESVYVGHTYTDGDETWGTVGNGGQWVKMSRMELVYDHTAFVEDHPEIESVSETFDAAACGTVYLWTYPGSGVQSAYICAADGTADEEDYQKVKITQKWTDENGGEWGYVPYFLALEGWIFLSDPETAPEESSVSLPPASGASGELDAAPKTGDGLTLVVILVVAVCLVTSALIAVFWKKNQKSMDKS